MMMLVELSDVAVDDALTEEEVDELVRALETEPDLLEVAVDVVEMEEAVEVLDAADEVEVDDDNANEVAELLLWLATDEEKAADDDVEAILALRETVTSLFLEGNPPTRKAESTMYERSVVLLIGWLDCALLR